jgi:hypothetical protein
LNGVEHPCGGGDAGTRIGLVGWCHCH